MKTKPMKTIIMLLILSLMSSNIFMLTSYAQSPEEIKLYPETSYDLNSNQEKEFALLDSFGETVYVTITPLNSSRVKDNSYKITHTKPNCWKASFIMNVKSNKIVSVSSSSVTAISGSVSSPILRKVSSSQATLNFKWRSPALPSGILAGIKAIISNGQIKVSAL